MSNQESSQINSELEANEQFCMSLKSLIDNGCCRKTLSLIAEELCDRAESIKHQYGTFN
jgi:hypothetical protein